MKLLFWAGAVAGAVVVLALLAALFATGRAQAQDASLPGPAQAETVTVVSGDVVTYGLHESRVGLFFSVMVAVDDYEPVAALHGTCRRACRLRIYIVQERQ